MVKIGHKIDEQGFFLEDILAGSGIEPDVNVICPNGFYKPRWNGTEWVEGLTQAEIDAIVNAPRPVTKEERIKALEDMLLELMLGGMQQ